MIRALHAMKVSDLQSRFINELQTLLPEWEYVKSQRHFKKIDNDKHYYFHISCINHVNDFDAVGDISIEFKDGKNRICIIGAELGNIEGIGQNRFPVSNDVEARASAINLHQCFEKCGLEFIQKYSDPVLVVDTLKRGGMDAQLISPFLEQHDDQIIRMSRHYGINM